MSTLQRFVNPTGTPIGGYTGFLALWMGGGAQPGTPIGGYRGLEALWMGGAGAATSTPTPTPTPTGQVGTAGGSGRYGRGKRSLFVLPDGQVVYATYEEVVALVQASAEPAEPKAPRKGLQKKQTAIRIVAKGPIPEAAIRMKGVKKRKVSLPNTYRWAPDPVQFAAALRKIHEQEEEDVVMMLAMDDERWTMN